jgi:hypothetical protein
MTNDPPHSPHSPKPEQTPDTIHVFNRVFLMSGKRQNQPEQYAEYHEQMIDETIPMEDRFDWQATKSRCRTGCRTHKAYGMSIDEYVKNRNQYIETDDNEHKQLSFYLPLFPSMVSSDYASLLKISTTRFLIMMIELGLISFQVDYQNQYEVVKIGRENLLKAMRNNETKNVYLQIAKHNIALGSCTGARNKDSKHHTPSVPKWLYDSVSDAATYLNMSTSDLVYLCWCIGVSSSFPPHLKNIMVDEDIQQIITHFKFEIDMYSKQISFLLSESENTT